VTTHITFAVPAGAPVTNIVPNETKWVTWEEFTAHTSGIQAATTFDGRYSLLKGCCTECRTKRTVPTHELWITLPTSMGASGTNEAHLSLEIIELPYDENSLREEFFVEPGDQPGGLYHYLKIYEHGGDGIPMLTIRISRQGTKGELVTLRKGKNVSGSTLMNIYRHFESMLRVDEMIIFDDMKFKKGEDALIPRRYVPIARSDGQTVYGHKLGFLPANVRGVFHRAGVVQFNQSRSRHTKASSRLRKTTLKGLTKIISKGRRTKEIRGIEEIARRVLGRRNIDDATLGELAQALLQGVGKRGGWNRLHTFSQTVLGPCRSTDSTPEAREFQKALEVLDDTRIFSRRAD
jgi:hypothetical protein